MLFRYLAETYDHSLASLIDPEEFRIQVKLHSDKIKEIFGVTPKVFRNSELIYQVVLQAYGHGYAGTYSRFHQGVRRIPLNGSRTA